jgi:hypothetical protein
MAFTTVSLRLDVARRFKAVKGVGESYSDALERLLDNQPAKSVGAWLESLAPLEGRGVFSAAGRAQLARDQRSPRPSARKHRAAS